MMEEYSGGYALNTAERKREHMLEWLEYVTRFKPNEMIRNAEEHRLIQEALAARGQDERFYYKALAALGRRLTTWGDWLQQQYDSAQQMPLELLPLEFNAREDRRIEL